MIRRQLLTWCVFAGFVLVVSAFPESATGQQSQAPARARVQTAPLTEPADPAQGRRPGGSQQAAQPRVARPTANLIEPQLSPELEALLVQWEQKSAKMEKLHGAVYRYHYDGVYGVERRAAGEFWYAAPDMGRIDLGPVKLPDPPENPEKKLPNGKPYTIQCEDRQRWICNGKMIYIINDDKKLADQVQIPAHQQGKNIVNGPLPFLFGMKAEQAKQRYHLALGNMHSTRLIHVVAAPKYEVDAAEWSRAEVLLDAASYLPSAIRLIHPHDNSETVYRFPLTKMKANEIWIINNPFNDKPPSNYTISQPTRATTDETKVAPPK